MKEKLTVVPPHFGAFPTALLRRRRMSMYISLFTVAIPGNCTSEFRELSEATMYIRDLKLI